MTNLNLKGEGRAMDKYIQAENVFDESNEDGCLLGRLNSSLAFLHSRLRLSTEEESRRINRKVQERLFHTLDEKVLYRYRMLFGTDLGANVSYSPAARNGGLSCVWCRSLSTTIRCSRCFARVWIPITRPARPPPCPRFPASAAASAWKRAPGWRR